EKRGERHTRAIGVANHGVSLGGQPRNGERHRNAVIAAWLNFRSAQFPCATPRHTKPVRPLFYSRAHAAQIFGQRRDSVALLHAQFSRVANLNAFFRERAKRGQHRQFINHQGDAFAGNNPPFEGSAFYGQVADDFSLRALQSEHLNRSAHFGKYVENRRTRGIQANIVDEHVRIGKQRSRREEKHSGRQISRNVQRFREQLSAAISSTQAEYTNRLSIFLKARAKFLQCDLRVVPRACRLRYSGHTFGEQSRQQHGRFHLRASHRHFVINGLQFRSANLQRREIILASTNIRAHFAQRRNHALHRPLLQGVVAGQPG